MKRWGRLGYRLGAGIWLGCIVFLFFGIAPTVFRVVPGRDADTLVKALFPTYYHLGVILGTLALCGALLALEAGRIRRWGVVAAGVVNLGMVGWAWSLLGVMNRLDAQSATFRALHQRSIVLGLASFVVTLVGFVADSLD